MVQRRLCRETQERKASEERKRRLLYSSAPASRGLRTDSPTSSLNKGVPRDSKPPFDAQMRATVLEARG
jgi:hypothetical protein